MPAVGKLRLGYSAAHPQGLEVAFDGDSTKFLSGDGTLGTPATPIADGDKGDIVVSGSGATWSFDAGVVTSFARSILDDANAAAVRATIGAGTGSGDALTSNPLSQFAATTSAQLAGVLSDETGSGALVFANSPTLVTPNLGTPASGVLTNMTGIDAWVQFATVTSGDQTAIGTSFADITSTGFSVVSGTYIFRYEIWADADATTTGIDIAVNGPTTSFLVYSQGIWGSATAYQETRATAYDNNTANANSSGTAARPYRVFGLATFTASGTLIARIKRENVGTGPNVRTGSWGWCQRIA